MYVSFKFQSDSINTIPVKSGGNVTIDFKFQSDSINTVNAICPFDLSLALNSNLILLILKLVFTKIQADAL